MTQYMVLFSLGPVQSFIAQARKTRDLWLGSFLLSILMEAGMKHLKEGKALVFPSNPTIAKNISDLPNKYIAIFDTIDEARTCVEDSEKAIRACWEGICKDVWSKIIAEYAPSGETNPSAIWKRQTNPDTFFEIFWVIVEDDSDNPNHYHDWLDCTQRALDARKHLRPITLRSDKIIKEPGEKSTLSGAREALHNADTEDGALRYTVREFWTRLQKRLVAAHINHDLQPDGEERLDAIDTVKRFAYRAEAVGKYVGDASFPSTSSIATASFVESLLQDSITLSMLQSWIDVTGPLADMRPDTIPYLQELANKQPLKISTLRRDGDCYFPETFTVNRLRKDYNVTDTAKAEYQAKKGREALQQLFQATDALGISRPTPYYAMIQMDGDKMGTLLSGVKSKDEHVKISRALSQFARGETRDQASSQSAYLTVPSIIEGQYPGRLIYAGGDDVFALAPLARDNPPEVGPDQTRFWTVLNLVDQLQQAYCATVKEAVLDDERQQSVTASVGIAIAHHYTSLSYVRRVSKEAEDLAKKRYGRNSLVVTVLRRSGEQTRVGCHWRYPGLEEEGQPVKLFTFFYQLFKQDVLSPKCVFNLLEEAPALIGLPEDAQKSEIRRVLRRQRSQGMEKKLPNETIRIRANYLVDLAKAMDNDEKRPLKENEKLSHELHSDTRRYGLVEVLGWLLVMVFLARKELD